jgi:hypothetical protein
MRGIPKWLIGFCVAGLIVGQPLVSAETQSAGRHASAEAKVERKLVGSWRLVSFVARSTDGKTAFYPFGKEVQGKLTYTRDRNIWALVRSKQIPQDVLWYTGTFRVDLTRRTIIHHVQYASISGWEGGDQWRPFKLSGSRLTLSASPAEPGGVTLVLKWKKVSGRPR